MEAENIIDYLLGPTGGVFALGLLIGGGITMKYIAPRLYSGELALMKERIEALEEEIRPYRDFKTKKALAAMENSGSPG